jgi:uncharacterized protein with ParB-like and HNH nuclease domain/predicted transport protein
MKATEAKFLDFLKKSPQFVIPIYQRAYSWTDKECQQLWDDILRAGSRENVSAHFIGSIVYVEKGLSTLTSQEPMLVIDGQQRLTTVTLILAGLARVLENLDGGELEPLDGFSPRKIRNYYLRNPEEAGERYYKLLLSQTDKASLKAIVDGSDQPRERSLRIQENARLFEELLAAQKADLVPVCKGLAKLIVVDIALNRDQDNPQLIFESMNSTGRELSEADLIRNFVLMGLEPQLQTRLYEEFWRPMELEFGQEAYGTHFDSFMRHYLTVKTGEIPNVGEVYEAFKKHARSTEGAAAGVEGLVKDMLAFARYFCAMALGKESVPELSHAFQDLRELKVDVAYPFLLELYADYKREALLRSELLKAVRIVEAYVFRRAICAIPTNSMNKTFATFTKAVDKTRYLESIEAQFTLLPSYRRFPRDEEFRRDLQTRDLYNFRSRSYWLRRLENYGRKERVVVDDYTIEHILPQNDNLPAAWQSALGPDWKGIQQTSLHTLGNLTLTGYNSEYSDRPFHEKRDMQGGFKSSPLRLNEGLGSLEHWDAHAIQSRAQRLAEWAIMVWRSPDISAATLESYRPAARPAEQYTLDDHPHLRKGPLREVYDAFRKEVLALDPCVTEEILKLYVAYKAETNFVDVVPQAKRLRLSLNMRFSDIDDPRGFCRNVTGLGRWGNGDVEVGLKSNADIPYVIGLVRQSLEQQLGNAADS